jgi:hypothetical protein
MWIMILFPEVPILFGSSGSKDVSEELADASHQRARNSFPYFKNRTRELRTNRAVRGMPLMITFVILRRNMRFACPLITT